MGMRFYELAAADPAVRFSPHCWRVRLALAHKGLEAERVAWRFADKAAIAPSGGGAVPVLETGEVWMADSWRIAVWLDETFPDRPALFAGPGGRGEAAFVKHWTETVVQPAILRMVVADIHAALDPGDRAYFRETREARLGAVLEDVQAGREARRPAFRESLAPLRRTLDEQAYLGGDLPQFSDHIVFAAFQWARTVSDWPLLAEDDPLHRWLAGVGGLYGGLADAAPRVAGRSAAS